MHKHETLCQWIIQRRTVQRMRTLISHIVLNSAFRGLAKFRRRRSSNYWLVVGKWKNNWIWLDLRHTTCTSFPLGKTDSAPRRFSSMSITHHRSTVRAKVRICMGLSLTIRSPSPSPSSSPSRWCLISLSAWTFHCSRCRSVILGVSAYTFVFFATGRQDKLGLQSQLSRNSHSIFKTRTSFKKNLGTQNCVGSQMLLLWWLASNRAGQKSGP